MSRATNTLPRMFRRKKLSAIQSSPTPILDLLKPLPRPYDERIPGRSAAPFLTAVATVLITQNYSLLAILLGAFVVGFLAVLVHELGHLFVGWAAGFRFDGITVGPFVLKRLRTGLTLRIRPRLASGLTYMSLKGIGHIRRRAILLCLGGAIASLSCGLAGLIGGEIARAYSDSPWPTFSEFWGFYSLLIGVFSFTAYRSGPFAGDGLLLRALWKSRDDATSLMAAHGLSALQNKNPDGVHWNSRWARIASRSRFVTPYQVDWYAYWAAQDSTSVALLLERCLASSHFVEREYRPHLIAEAVKFCAWDRGDLGKAQNWLGVLQNPNALDPLSFARMNVALSCAAKDFNSAIRHWDAGLRLIQQSPPGKSTRDYETSWRAWKTQIQARQAKKPETLDLVLTS
jgi:hypothetical protein